jgi:hypothetical protein
MKEILTGILAFVLLLAAGRAEDTSNQIMSASAPPARVVVPDERDCQVMEVALLHLLADPELGMWPETTNRSTIVLHARPPEKTGMSQTNQMRADFYRHPDGLTIPEELQLELVGRNLQPGTEHNSVAASFKDLKLDARIVVADLTDRQADESSVAVLFARMNAKPGGRPSVLTFKEAFPDARCWVEAYLPGYSRNGTRAVVRGWIGPTPHGASITVLLEKTGEKWSVKWHHLAQDL